MDWRTVDKLILWLAVIVAGFALYEGYHLVRTSQLNNALAAIAAGDLVTLDHPRARFARAFELQQAGEFEQALETYAAIDTADDDRLQAAVRYNLANLYFRRALQYRDDGADDLVLPLIELAKENYRELLRGNSTDWATRYNFELALRVAPETDLEEVHEERNPEHNPRSAAGIKVRKPLP